VALSPDLYRYARTFWPIYKHRRKGVKLSFGKSFFDQIMRGTNWSLDKLHRSRPSACTTPRQSCRSSARRSSSQIPNYKDVEVAEAWGGTIDRTPDTIPVISPIDTMLGLFLATGFS
jgi:glycine/D-amino acid oxidase-like deaminating enzyme